MRGERWGLLAIPLTLLGGVGWVSGLYAAAKTQSWFLFTIDFVIPPIGFVHGWGFLLGFW
jgi:hypothetical protein